MIRCQVCGYDNKDDAELCLNCGETLVKAKVSQAMDDVSDEATVLIDPAAMQKRIQEEIKKEKPATPAAPSLPPAGAPPRPVASPAPARPAAAPAAAPAPAASAPAEGKQWLIALILGILIPGAARVYVGKIGSGIAQFVTAFFCVGVIWQIWDVVQIVTDKFTDADGRPLVKK